MASPQATIYDRDDAVVATPAATPSTVETTVLEDVTNTRQRFQIVDATNVQPGVTLFVTSPSWGSAASVVSAVEGSYVRLVEPLPDVPAPGATVVGLDVDVVIPAFTETYMGFVLEVDDVDVDSVRLVFNVVRFPFVGPCTARHVRELVSRGYPGEVLKDEVLHARAAESVNARIRGRLLASANWMSSYWDPDALAVVRTPMLKLVLAEEYRMRESGSTADDYLRSLRFEVRDRIADVLKSAEVYDANRDGRVTDEEAEGRVGVEWTR